MANEQYPPRQDNYQSGYTNPNHQYHQQSPYNQQPPYNQGHQQPPYNQGYQQQYNPGYQQPQYNPYDEFPNATQSWRNNDVFADGPSGKNRGVFAILAFFLGWLGVHYFYLGKIGAGFVFLIVYWLISCLTCFWGVGLVGWVPVIQAVVALCISNARFERTFCDPNNFMPFF